MCHSLSLFPPGKLTINLKWGQCETGIISWVFSNENHSDRWTIIILKPLYWKKWFHPCISSNIAGIFSRAPLNNSGGKASLAKKRRVIVDYCPIYFPQLVIFDYHRKFNTHEEKGQSSLWFLLAYDTVLRSVKLCIGTWIFVESEGKDFWKF